MFVSGLIFFVQVNDFDSLSAGSHRSSTISLKELFDNPSDYSGRDIEVVGTLIVSCPDTPCKALTQEYFLQKRNYQIKVFPWAPYSVAMPPPEMRNAERQPPPIMGYFVNQKIKIYGTWIQSQSGYGLKTQIPNVTILSEP